MKFNLSSVLTCIVCFVLVLSLFGGLDFGDERHGLTDEFTASTEITIGRLTFDTAANEQNIPSDFYTESYYGDRGLYLVQFTQNAEPWMLDDLRALGATELQHINPNTYRIEMAVDSEEDVRTLSFVQWLGIYQPWYKMSDEVAASDGTVTIELRLTDTGDVNHMSHVVKSYGGSVDSIDADGIKILRATIDANAFHALASDPSVVWISKYHPPQAYMDLIRQPAYTGANTVHLFGHTGANVLGQVKDNGCDLGHQELTNVIYTQGGPGVMDHGTCTTGIVFATGVDPDSKGMIPSATGCFSDWGVNRYTGIQNLWNGFGGPDSGVFESNSWSQGTLNGQYTTYSNQDDEAMYDYPKIIMLYAAGNCNNGPGYGMVTQDCINKNGLGIGAAWHDDTSDMSDDYWVDDPIWGGGSRGYAADSRVKPDLCGPYDYIYCPDITGAAGYRSGDYVTREASDMYFGGTSGATPVVAGQVGLAYGMYMNNFFGNNPTSEIPYASTIKAIMIADAYQYPIGVNDIDRHVMGWGSADIENVFDLGANGHYIKDHDDSVSAGGTVFYNVTPVGINPLKITLCWTDPEAPAGTGSGRALINDLDLKVISPGGTEYYGNNGLDASHWSASGTGTNDWAYPTPAPDDYKDGINNVENVFISTPMGGKWTIAVSGRVGGVPDGPMPFSLVASGAQEYVPGNPPTVTLTVPNGGENWEVGTFHDITWTMDDIEDPPASLAVTLDYSTNGGASYPNNIITGQTGFGSSGVYNWQVPNDPSTTVRVRVTVVDTEAGAASDESDGNFEIYVSSPFVDVISPDVGDRLMGGGTWDITWTATPGSFPLIANPISIDWSTNAGGPWTPIPTDGANDGIETWSVPVMEGNAYVRVQAEDTQGYIGEDINGPFWIDLTPPQPATNPYAEFTGSNDVTVYWTASPSSDLDHYEIWFIQNGWDSTGDTYGFLDSVPGGTTNYVHALRGVDNQNSYAYQVRTFDEAGHEVRTTIQAAKFSRTMSYAGNPSHWWLLGSCIVQSDTSLNHVIQGQGFPANWDYAMAWDAANTQWISYLKGRPDSVNYLSDITNEIGFWLHITGNARFATAGYIDDMSINCYAGWNLVPYPYAERLKTAAQIEADLLANCPNYLAGSLQIFDYNEPYGIRAPAGDIFGSNEEGFWIQVSADTTWTVTNY